MPNCIVCLRKLNPDTSVPRWSEETLNQNPRNRQFYDEAVAKRRQEIESGEVGLHGEGEFCNKECATFFARSCVTYFRHITFVPDDFELRIQQVRKLAQRTFQWVQDRMAKK